MGRARYKVMGISIDGAGYKKWKTDIEGFAGQRRVSDCCRPDLTMAKAFGMLPAEAYMPGRTHASGQCDGAVFIIGAGQEAETVDDLPDERRA
jgi:hypothetical protein